MSPTGKISHNKSLSNAGRSGRSLGFARTLARVAARRPATHHFIFCGFAPPCRWAARAGFTLIELMVTLALAGLMLALVPPLLDKGGDRARLLHDQRDLVSQLRLARSEAIAGDRPVTLRFDLAKRLYGIERLDQSIDSGIAVTLDTPLAELGEIRFFADGSTSGAVIGLANRSGSARVRVDWLTGSVEVVP